MTTKTELQVVIQDIENFILKVEKKLPSDVKAACETADKYIDEALILLNNNPEVAVLEKLIPETVPYAQAVIGILNILKKCFTAVDAILQPTLVIGAGAAIAAAIHGSGASAETFLAPYSVLRSSNQI